MIDSLGGILLNGLLGNGPSSLILGFFNLGLFDVTVTVTPVKGHPQVYPNIRPSDDDREDDKYLTFKIRLKDKEISKVYRVSNGKAQALIKLSESKRKLVKKTSVTVNKFVVKPIKRVFKIKLKDQSNK